jgi:multidrug transporter EmrE-like cation transporter
MSKWWDHSILIVLLLLGLVVAGILMRGFEALLVGVPYPLWTRLGFVLGLLYGVYAGICYVACEVRT